MELPEEADPADPFELDAVLRRPSWLTIGLALSPGAVGLWLAAVAVTIAPTEYDESVLDSIAAMGAMLVEAALLGAYSVWLNNAGAGRRRGIATATADGVFFDGTRIASRDALSLGTVSPLPRRGAIVRLFGRRALDRIELEVATVGHGKRLLRRLELDAGHSQATLTMSWNALRSSNVFLALLFAWPMGAYAALASIAAAFRAWTGSPPGGWVGIATVALYALASWQLWRATSTHVTVGPDGLRIRRFGRTRFIGYARIASVERWPERLAGAGLGVSEGLDLTLVSGEVIPLRTLTARRNQGELTHDFTAERIEETVAAHRRSAERFDPRLLRRAGSSAPEWIAALRGGGAGAGAGPRTSAPAPDQLWAIVEDPAAEPLARACAAVALGGTADPAAQKRLRIAAGAVASPALRVALESASDATDEAALEQALTELEASR